MQSFLVGTWVFVNLFYHGEILPLPNPDLKIVYDFYSDGTSHLHYHREGEKGSCDRLALYNFSGLKLYQQVTWVAPHNADFCGQDPDMQLGAISDTAAELRDGKFFLTLSMGEEDVIYIWEKVK